MRRSAFSLMELLVVIVIISVLAAMLMPTIKLVRSRALQLNCINNQRQVMLGIAAYAHENEGMTPAAAGNFPAWNSPFATSVTALLYLGYIDAGKVVAWSGGGCMNPPSMRWPNAVSCTAFKPLYNPNPTGTLYTMYNVRWTFGGPFNGEMFVYNNGGSAILGTLRSTIPYLADTVVTANPVFSGYYWAPNYQANGIGIRMGHSGRTVSGYADGHAASNSKAQMVEQGIASVVLWP